MEAGKTSSTPARMPLKFGQGKNGTQLAKRATTETNMFLLGTLHLLPLLLVGTSAGAQTPPDARHSTDDRSSGLSSSTPHLCEEALRHAHRGEFEEARTLYARAFDADPSTPILFNLAVAEMYFPNRAVDALAHLREYLKRDDAEPARVVLIQTKLLPRALAATGHLRLVWTPTERVLLGWTSTPLFTLDGESVHVEGDVLDVLPGPHILLATTPDGSWSGAVQSRAGESIVPAMRLVLVAHRAGP